MSRFYPRSEYPEDQPYTRTILTGHVLSRGFTVGAFAGLGVGAVAHLATRNSPPNILHLDAAISPDFRLSRPLSLKLLQSAGYGSFIGVGLATLSLAAIMRGREDIEWRDRSWRLLRNKGQVDADDWIGLGALAGLAVVVSPPVTRRYGGIAGLGWRGVLGGAAVGSVAGMLGFVCDQVYSSGRHA
ncbi:hypothetical protein BC835DRAFT_902331 [Cytidiella melzeri]|nr:hypothetical protein BC835DRAFT_902331 [Cytidiella melzeri]